MASFHALFHSSKKMYMKNGLSFRILLFLLIAILASCGKNESASGGKVPDLLQRNESVMNGKEWDQVQNFYAENLNRLLKNAKDQDAMLNLSEVFIQEARITGESGHYYPAALKMIDQILKDKPKNKEIEFRALANQASVMMSLHQFRLALETAQKAVALNPYNAQIYGVLVDANVELGHYEDAVKMADKMVSIRPDLRSYSRVSYLRQIHGDNEGAIEAMNMATEAGYPGAEDTEWARVTLGDLLLNVGDLKNAAGVYQTTLQNRAGYPYAEIGLAKVEKANANYDAAIKHTETAIRIMSLPAFVDLLSDLYELKGDKAKAQEIRSEVVSLLEEAEKEEPKDTPVKHNGARELAMAYLKNNKLDKALQFAQTDLQMRPDNIDANELVAWIYYLKGDYENAKMHADKMLKTNIKNVNTLYKASLIYTKAGDVAKGNQYAQEAKATSAYMDDLLKKQEQVVLN